MNCDECKEPQKRFIIPIQVTTEDNKIRFVVLCPKCQEKLGVKKWLEEEYNARQH